MSQDDPNKLYVGADNKVNAADEQPKPKNASAFLHLPVELEKEVNAYINQLAKERNIEWESEAEDGKKSIFESQGCFFVISLERIEDLMKKINTCLALKEDDMDEIKKNLNQAMDIINGI